MTDPTNSTAKQQDSQQENDQRHKTQEEHAETAKDFEVLNKDGSLPDLHYNNEPGGGPLEGTVGIGT